MLAVRKCCFSFLFFRVWLFVCLLCVLCFSIMRECWELFFYLRKSFFFFLQFSCYFWSCCCLSLFYSSCSRRQSVITPHLLLNLPVRCCTVRFCGFGSVLSGSVRFGSALFVSVRFGTVLTSYHRLCSVLFDSVAVRLGRIRFGVGLLFQRAWRERRGRDVCRVFSFILFFDRRQRNSVGKI